MKDSNPFFIAFARNPGLEIIIEEDPDYSYPKSMKPGESIKNFSERYVQNRAEKLKAAIYLRRLLGNIVRDRRLAECEELRFFLKAVEIYRPQYLVDNGKLIEKWALIEGEVAAQTWLRDLSASLLAFLQEKDIKLINKCYMCHEYYSAGKIDRRNKYCPPCSRKTKWSKDKRTQYQRHYRGRKQADREIRIKEQFFERIMKAGFTRNETEEMWQADKPDWL